MEASKITGIFLSVHGAGPKYALRRKVGPFHEQYDVYRPWDKIDIVRELVKLLDAEFEGFLEKFVTVDDKHFRESSHRSRHYISADLASLYPGKNDDFRKKYSFSYKDYWIGTNVGAKEIVQYVREMAEACDVTFAIWSDLKL